MRKLRKKTKKKVERLLCFYKGTRKLSYLHTKGTFDRKTLKKAYKFIEVRASQVQNIDIARFKCKAVGIYA